ncbi:MAG TPA: GtrA family protein [Anaerolineaceae bacterium]|nr:GtrA family protein [Anaerolineaceae bacterium]HPN50834.1 GtrA family protein [Anaerolineaceae bacterium]
MILTDAKERERFLRFAVVGVIGAVVDFGLFNLLSDPLGVNSLVASVISFCAAVANNFVWNRYWIYPDSRSKQLKHQMVQFALVNVIGLMIRTPIFGIMEYLLVDIFQALPIQLPFTPKFLGHNFALATAVGVVMMWNFFVNRYWTYSDVKSSHHSAMKVS